MHPAGAPVAVFANIRSLRKALDDIEGATHCFYNLTGAIAIPASAQLPKQQGQRGAHAPRNLVLPGESKLTFQSIATYATFATHRPTNGYAGS